MASTLLSLPLELRELIYENLFSSYTVRHGFGRASSSNSNRTAILQICKQIHHEAWRFLPLNIQFHFRGTEAMLETLLSVDQPVVTRIRHIRVKAFPFPLYANGHVDYYPTYYFSNALSLLPGLHLERLVVEDCFHGFALLDGWRDVVTYMDIEALLKSDAWKELQYITPNTDFITSGYDHRRRRVAQPENWNALLQERDGETSGAEVQMFITPEPSNSDMPRDAITARPWSAKPGHEVMQNFRIAGPDQDLKGEARIVARRGKKARYIQTGLSEKKTWSQLKEKGFTREDWVPYYNDMADAVGWIYGGWGRRLHLANMALS
ncbi:hypothetical protein K469DRAFT_599711 [Zopfia rhizophila CBS 207.26]|uniref:F-box domain-containing protein n=1 Tax=Zopfia rhizophila CBS 207.26 TaxID=1314779 RepID=A0A6A6DK65_9PEZI|nr:hypothetical protein K469DRAFT_599711 [Zopfia rhizophila CBS 207.26]